MKIKAINEDKLKNYGFRSPKARENCEDIVSELINTGAIIIG